MGKRQDSPHVSILGLAMTKQPHSGGRPSITRDCHQLFIPESAMTAMGEGIQRSAQGADGRRAEGLPQHGLFPAFSSKRRAHGYKTQ